MTETQAPVEIAPEPHAQARNAYLPVPPDGWEYKVELIGPKGARIVTTHQDDTTVVIEVKTSGVTKRFTTGALKDGVRSAVDAAKALNAISEHEERAESAKQKLLDTIGGDAIPSPEN